MRAKTIIPILLLALSTWPAAIAFAQDIPVDRVRMAVDRTEARIQQATAVLGGSNNPEANSELDAAVSLQSQARDALRQARGAPPDEHVGLLRRAVDLTGRARERADRAISLIQGLPDPDRVTGQLDRTRELISRARARLAECNNDRAPELLRMAGDMQATAENAAAENHYLVALRLTMGARERVMRAAMLCNQQERPSEASDRALRRTDEVILGAKDVLGPGFPPRARTLMRLADGLQAEAWSQYRLGHLEPSLRLTLNARNLAQRALRRERQ
jgi:hypothetical protein